jgi:hypothetical protein
MREGFVNCLDEFRIPAKGLLAPTDFVTKINSVDIVVSPLSGRGTLPKLIDTFLEELSQTAHMNEKGLFN